MTLTITPTENTLGAVVTGLDLAEIDDETFARIEQAWHRHAVLAFPEQNLCDETHIAFSRRFGSLERNVTANNIGDNPEVIVLSNVKEDGSLWKPESSHGLFLKGNSYWHTDSSFKRVPAMASLLRACQVPSEGGETEFADMRAAYDELDGELRDRLDDKIAVHSYGYSQSQVGGMKALSEDEWNAVPPVEHPVIRTHPATARKNLYIGRHASHIKGEDVEESRRLLISLCEDACRAPRTYKHSWRPGDPVIWDNRCVLHRGHGYPGDQPRVMVRTTVAGEEAGNEWTL